MIKLAMRYLTGFTCFNDIIDESVTHKAVEYDFGLSIFEISDSQNESMLVFNWVIGR